MRHVLEEARIHEEIRAQVSDRNRDIVEEVERATAEHDLVVVGMKINPHECGPADVAHSSFRRAAIAFALETSLTLPGVSIGGEESVFGQLNGQTLVLSLLETSLTLPEISIGGVSMLR